MLEDSSFKFIFLGLRFKDEPVGEGSIAWIDLLLESTSADFIFD